MKTPPPQWSNNKKWTLIVDFLTVETKLRFENPFIITYTVLYKLSCVEQEAITHTEDIFFFQMAIP